MALELNENECIFSSFGKCNEKTLSTCGESRIRSIIKSSKVRGDDLHIRLSAYKRNCTENGKEIAIQAHRNCVSSYASKRNSKIHAKETLPKRKRSSSELFNFQENCLYCPEVKKCILPEEYGPKTPKQRRTLAFPVRTNIMADGKTSYKQFVLDVCDSRNDELGNVVRDRVLTAVGDLHAADARYHDSCRKNFFRVHFQEKVPSNNEDPSFNAVICEMKKDITKIWNSVQLFDLYREQGGQCMERRTLFAKLSTHLGDSAVVLSSPGLANLIAFKEGAGETFHSFKEDSEGIEISIVKVASQIKKECMELKTRRRHYACEINKDIADHSVSETLSLILSKVSPSLDRTLPATMIGNIITSTVTYQPTDLLISIGVFLNRQKESICELSKYNVCCSYDEVKRFKHSAAVAVAEDWTNGASFNASDGLIHICADNFDSEIHSQNCKTLCHALAMVVGQTGNDRNISSQHIPRLSKEDMAKDIPYELELEVSNCPKKPTMPSAFGDYQVPRLTLLSSQVVAQSIADDLDFKFIKDIITKEQCPEYNGYMTKVRREASINPQPATQIKYLPLINHTPADHGTMLTAMKSAVSLCQAAGQKVVPFTVDQQLYKVAVDLIFHYQSLFKDLVPILGGMHFLESFVSSIGTLAGPIGLRSVLGGAFGSVDAMLNGKKFPQNVRALRMVVEELLRSIFLNESPPSSMEELQKILQDKSEASRTTKAWVINVITPVFLMLKFCRASHEGDFALHVSTAEEMLPYFFSAGHPHYARYGCLYVDWMKRIPSNLHQAFMKGQSSIHLKAGIFNGIWTDQFIECTWMRNGHGPSGVTGLTSNEKQVQLWSLSAAVCGQIRSQIKMIGKEDVNKVQMKHKEEATSRMKNDSLDRGAVRATLELCIDPLNEEEHEGGQLLNIVNGQLADATVNVDQSLVIGSSQLSEFRSSWPSGFYDTIKKKVLNFDPKKKHIRIGEHQIFDQGLVYARAIGLFLSNRDIDFSKILSSELSPYPASIFDENGILRTAKAKSALKTKLEKVTSARSINHDRSALVIDASAFLYTLTWPGKGKVQDLVSNMNKAIGNFLKENDVYLVFDRYYTGSPKEYTRILRTESGSKVHKLHLASPLPSREVCLKVSKNKEQLYEFFVKNLTNPETAPPTDKHTLIVTGKDPVPMQIDNDIKIYRHDLRTTHEEADVIVVQQAMFVAQNKLASCVIVQADDTDIFALLLHFNQKLKNTVPIFMETPKKDKGRGIIDIIATANQWEKICPDLLAIHGLSGCDTVAAYHGIGKNTALKTALEKKLTLSSLGKRESNMDDIISECTAFLTQCYGYPAVSMTDCRQKVWAKRIASSSSSTPELSNLPPTSEAALHNFKRAHYQVMVWMSTMEADPPSLDPCDYGWEKGISTEILPKTVDCEVPLVPHILLKLIKCGCKSEVPCKTTTCTCRKSNIVCTVFCCCSGGVSCCNKRNVTSNNDNED